MRLPFSIQLSDAAQQVRAQALGTKDNLERLRLHALADTIAAEGRIQRRNEQPDKATARPYVTRELLRRRA